MLVCRGVCHKADRSKSIQNFLRKITTHGLKKKTKQNGVSGEREKERDREPADLFYLTNTIVYVFKVYSGKS